MNSVSTKWKSRNLLAAMLSLQFTFCITVLFDISVARQILGFVFLTFVPGYIIMRLLKLNELDRVETIVFSAGLSIAFMMTAGLLVNEIYPILGISQPLTLVPLATTFNVFVVVGAILVWLRREDSKLRGIGKPSLSPLALLLALPFLSIAGALLVNAYGNNLILLSMIIIIALLFVTSVLSKKLFPSKLYSLAVLVISLSLLYQSCFVSNYITTFGSDVSREFLIFRTTQTNALWVPTNPYSNTRYGRTYSMLSVTILPTTYSNLLNLDPAMVFKILYPLIFSFVPLGLYEMWKKGLGGKYAFIATFFFMSVSTFFTEMLALNKQIVAELFLVLLLLTIFGKKMKPNTKMACFVIFSFALVTSHYAIAEIFSFFILFVLLLQIATRRSHNNITVAMVVFFLVMMFFWYVYTTGSSVFDSFVSYSDYVYNSLSDFFNPSARQPEVLRALALETPPTIWNAISRAFAYVTEVLVVAGFIGLITKRVRIRWDREYFLLTSAAMGLLASLIVVPGLSETMNMTRFYHVLLFFLAPLCIVGARFLVGLVFKRNRKLWACTLLLVVLVPYFLFQTGFMYEVTGSESWSLPLSKHRMSTYELVTEMGYVYEQDVYSAQWYSKNVDFQSTQMYVDGSVNLLATFGLVLSDDAVRLTNIATVTGELDDAVRLTNITTITQNGIVYLNKVNIVDGTIGMWNLTDFSFLDNMNRIYTNGGSEIYRNMP